MPLSRARAFAVLALAGFVLGAPLASPAPQPIPEWRLVPGEAAVGSTFVGASVLPDGHAFRARVHVPAGSRLDAEDLLRLSAPRERVLLSLEAVQTLEGFARFDLELRAADGNLRAVVHLAEADPRALVELGRGEELRVDLRVELPDGRPVGSSSQVDVVISAMR